MRIAIVSDTHMPKGSRAVPDRCVAALREADLVIHAGDFFEQSVLEWLESLGPPVHAVHGNVDSPALHERLPETLEFEVGGRTIAVVHDSGQAKGRLARLRRRFPEADLVVFGHSHLPFHEAGSDGFQIFNPGSPTERRRAPKHSFGIAEVTKGRIDVRHVWL